MDWEQFDWLIDAALREDRTSEDVTTLATVPPDAQTTAELQVRAEGVVCGLPLAGRMAVRFDERISFEALVQDGDRVAAGGVAARLTGPAGALLSLERTMLNFLQHLSGVATLTAAYVDRVGHTAAHILDTRKTTPGWRALEKYAVRCGGGHNHRMDLADQALIKDNHLALVGASPHDPQAVRAAVRRVRDAFPGVPVEVEVEDMGQLAAAVAAAPDVILLDNMPPGQVAEALAFVVQSCGADERPLLEASGGITMDNVAAYAEAGADLISVGALTHSAPAFDLALEIEV
jgi:nicotinate-nucleotide pyrophosphorylase (carboxylating)